MGRAAAKRAALGAILAALALAAPSGALGAECLGDECQGPPPAPEEVIPATAVIEGPPNPPVRFPKHHGKHHKGKKQQGKGHHAKNAKRGTRR